MEEFKKPQHLVIDAMSYLTEIMGNGLIKDLQEKKVMMIMRLSIKKVLIICCFA